MPLFKKRDSENDITDSYDYIEERLIVDTKRACLLKPKKKRSDLIKQMKIGDRVTAQVGYLVDGKPVYLVIDPKSKLDIGELSYGTSEYFYDKFRDREIIGFLSDEFRGSFHARFYVKKMD